MPKKRIKYFKNNIKHKNKIKNLIKNSQKFKKMTFKAINIKKK